MIAFASFIVMLLNLIIAIVLPLGVPFYFFEMYNRKLLIHDIKVVQKISVEVKQIIIENIQAKQI